MKDHIKRAFDNLGFDKVMVICENNTNIYTIKTSSTIDKSKEFTLKISGADAALEVAIIQAKELSEIKGA